VKADFAAQLHADMDLLELEGLVWVQAAAKYYREEFAQECGKRGWDSANMPCG